jgi:hypothetical protein
MKGRKGQQKVIRQVHDVLKSGITLVN